MLVLLYTATISKDKFCYSHVFLERSDSNKKIMYKLNKVGRDNNDKGHNSNCMCRKNKNVPVFRWKL